VAVPARQGLDDERGEVRLVGFSVLGIELTTARPAGVTWR